MALVLAKTFPALAVQQHSGAEGLVSHQLGHVLFVSGMVFLLFSIYHRPIRSPGWREFKLFVWLILSWNLLTFTGHGLAASVEASKYVTSEGLTTGYRAEGFGDYLFYASRLDHLVLVPSFLFLFLALWKWSRQP